MSNYTSADLARLDAAIATGMLELELAGRKVSGAREQREGAAVAYLELGARAGVHVAAEPVRRRQGRAGRRPGHVHRGSRLCGHLEGGRRLRDAMDLAYLTGQRPADTLRMRETDIRDGVLHVQQGKTGERLRIAVGGELAAVIERIKARKAAFAVYNTVLVVNDYGRPVSLQMQQRRWQEARKEAGLPRDLQFRDLRAKAGTDKADSTGDARQAQKQLGHTTITTTEGYPRNRRGAKVTPTR